MNGSVYAQYSYKPEYDGTPRTFGGFGILPGFVEGRPAVLIKQRNGKGSSKWQFDLPGGGVNDSTDPGLEAAARREVQEEVGLDCTIVARIGSPLWFPIRKGNNLVRVDCAQSFLVSAQGTPRTTEEALAIAFVHQDSAIGFNIVSRVADPDPTKRIFGRTPVMIYDGLSVLQSPFFEGPLTAEIETAACEPLSDRDFVLIDGGRYFGRCYWIEEGTDKVKKIALYYRLNPFEDGGRFHGSFDQLAKV